MVRVILPPKQTFGKKGYVYAVEYECGVQEKDTSNTARGVYRSNILVHNNRDRPQKVYVKILGALPTPSSDWLRHLEKQAIEIAEDGAIDIDCDDVRRTLGLKEAGFLKGLIIISQEMIDDLDTPGLDVTASYTCLVISNVSVARPESIRATILGTSKHVMNIPGSSVPRVPMPTKA